MITDHYSPFPSRTLAIKLAFSRIRINVKDAGFTTQLGNFDGRSRFWRRAEFEVTRGKFEMTRGHFVSVDPTRSQQSQMNGIDLCNQVVPLLKECRMEKRKRNVS